MADVARQAQLFGLVATISGSTVWRWLNADAIRPWQHRCWIFPRDPQFALKAGRILDLYERRWQGPLRADELVLSTDEKTSIQASRARQLAQPDRDLLLHRAAQGAYAQRFRSLAAVEERLLAFQDYYEAIAKPFAWTFTRRDLADLLHKLRPHRIARSVSPHDSANTCADV